MSDKKEEQKKDPIQERKEKFLKEYLELEKKYDVRLELIPAQMSQAQWSLVSGEELKEREEILKKRKEELEKEEKKEEKK